MPTLLSTRLEGLIAPTRHNEISGEFTFSRREIAIESTTVSAYPISFKAPPVATSHENSEQLGLPLVRCVTFDHAAACHGSLAESLSQKSKQLIDGVES